MTDDNITAILAYLRESFAGIYVQKKIDQIKDKEDTQNWKEFVREIRTIFSNKSKVADIK